MRNIAKRHKFIIEQLEKDGSVKVQDLSQILGVSEVTIRKDLKDLESRKLLYRSHGSASSISSIITDRHVDEKEKMFIDEKNRIANTANELIQNHDKIIIASGTTLLTFANEITQDKEITVITSSVKVSLSLSYKQNIEVIQLGGIMRKNSVSVIGYFAEHILKGLVCNKLFIGVDGIDLDYGLTTSNMDEARINQIMLDVSQKIIVLTDSSKFGKRGFCKICGLDRIHHIITDKNAPSNVVELIREKGIEVTLV